uniref:Uncharacterized protein n=1 Tax=Arundo donax TaxID=35708 RepID=A0A0A9F895_ARUDO
MCNTSCQFLIYFLKGSGHHASPKCSILSVA